MTGILAIMQQNFKPLKIYTMYCFTTNGKKITLSEMPYNTYALAGLQYETDKGLLTVHVPEGLTPLCNENGIQYRMIDKAGLSFNGKTWYNQ